MINEKTKEKLKKKLAADGVQLAVDDSTFAPITRNMLKSTKRRANLRHGGHQLENELSYGRSNSLGAAASMATGAGKFEPVSEYSETAQEIKMRKAAEKRARKAGKLS